MTDPWPAAHALLIADGEWEGGAPAPVRTTVRLPSLARQASGPDAPRRLRSLRWLCLSDPDAAAWIAWAAEHAHRLWTGLPGERSATARWRLVGGLAGARLTPYDAGGGRRAWRGEAEAESPDP